MQLGRLRSWRIRLAAAVALLGMALAPLRPAAAPQETIVNRHASPIIAVFATPVADQNWDFDKLAGIILTNQRWLFRGEGGRGCTWDIFVIFQNGQVEEKRNQNLCQIGQVEIAGQAARAPTDRDPSPPGAQTHQPADRGVDVMIVNQGPATMVGLFTQSPGAGGWSSDHLGTGTLRPQGRFHLRRRSSRGCRWNVHLVFAGGHVDERTGIDLCVLSELTVAGRAVPGQVIAFATGFYVSRDGHVLTTHHAIRSCTSVAIARQGGERIALTRVADDAEQDLACSGCRGCWAP